MVNTYNKFQMIIRINSLSINYCWQPRAPRRPPGALPELRQSNTYSKYCFRDKNKYRTKTIIFLEVYRLQLGQIHDQHIHQLSNRYMHKFPSIYLFVNSYLPGNSKSSTGAPTRLTETSRPAWGQNKQTT